MSNNCILINDDEVELPYGIHGRNYLAEHGAPLPHFKHKRRRRLLKHLVLHETAGNTAEGCMKTLKRKGYGVHLILDRDGYLTCHGDLATETMIHANRLNPTSVGIEVVNPYAPKLVSTKNNLNWDYNTIPAEWWTWCPDKKDRRYVLPTDEQLKTLEILVPWLCNELDIPYVFPTWYLNPRVRKINKWKKPKAGVVAHRDFAKHADGRYLLEWLMVNYTREYALYDHDNGGHIKGFNSFYTKEQTR